MLSRVASEPSYALISGQFIRISGETVIGKISGETLYLSSGTGPIIARISGETIRALSSGETYIAKVSGETIIGKVSGETVIGKVSGETIIGKVSGETIDVKVPTSVKTGLIRVVTAASGGAVLHSGTVNAVTIKGDATNSGNIYVGGEVNRPYSGFGFPLATSEAVNVNVDDFSRIYVCATISGEKVGFLGVA